MKETIIETAGRAWQLLAQKGEVSVDLFPKLINQKSEIAYQALGWLAREDKINYNQKNGKTVVSLVESEIQNFKNSISNLQSNMPSEAAKRATKFKR